MEAITINEFIVLVTVLFILIAMLNLYYTKHEYVWHEMFEIPNTNTPISNVSEDIIIFDLTTEKQYDGYYDNQQQKFVANKDKSVEIDYFKWRYKSLNY